MVAGAAEADLGPGRPGRPGRLGGARAGASGIVACGSTGHGGSLQSSPVGRLTRILGRLEQVLDLAESWLRDETGRPPPPRFFREAVAFRWDSDRGAGRLVAVPRPSDFDLDDLQRVERAVEQLVRNTEQLVRGLPAQHVLLYGERGTGKSSAVRGLLTRFAPRGLRLVEVRKRDLIRLPQVLDALRGADPDLRFLIFCDDLAFDEGEPGTRELKAALEGSVEAPPPNVRIVVTSNRRHLVPESMAENRAARVDEHGDLHLGEALDEKLALSDRFGLVIGFYAFDQDAYLAIVRHWAGRAGIELPWEEVREQALRFALRRASRTGRTARHFVDDLAGRLALERGEEAPPRVSSG